MLNRTEQPAVRGLSQRLNYASETESEQARLVDVLTELRDLLEQYSPSWYTQKHHEKTESALQLLTKA